MATESQRGNIASELQRLKLIVGTMIIEDCSEEENKQFSRSFKSTGNPPDGVLRYDESDDESDDRFYRLYPADASDAELAEYLTYKQFDFSIKQIELLKRIKSMLTFFVVLTILGLVSALILLFI